MTAKPKVLDLFAGCGGFSLGFERAGYEIAAFVEWWDPAIQTFQRNHPNAVLLGRDITKISDEKACAYHNAIDVLIGGPPCQGFSLCGKRNPKDKRNKLYKEFLRFVEIVNPRIVIMENVPGLLTVKNENGENVFSLILKDLIKRGYSVSYSVLTASEYGVPQERKRLIIIGRRLSLFPPPTRYGSTVMQAIGDLPNRVLPINGHQFFETTPQLLDKIRTLKQGERLSSTFNFSRQRLHADKRSKTITTKSMYIHPFYDRFLTPRELARLQSFPDSFNFCGTKTAMVKQIGNAVPPLLAQALAEHLKKEVIFQ